MYSKAREDKGIKKPKMNMSKSKPNEGTNQGRCVASVQASLYMMKDEMYNN